MKKEVTADDFESLNVTEAREFYRKETTKTSYGSDFGASREQGEF